MSALRKACGKFRVTAVLIILLQIAFIILFGFQFRYSPIAMPNLLPPDSGSDAATPSNSMMGDSTTTTTQMMMASLSFVSINGSLTAVTNPTTLPISFNGSPATQALVAGDTRDPGQTLQSTQSTGPTPIPEEAKIAHVTDFYTVFEGIHVMMFIGFGFLMTFLKKYGYSSVGYNFLLGAFVLQWATLTAGWINYWDTDNKKSYVDLTTLINSDFCCAAILISLGAVLGKVSALQLVVMAFIEVVAFQANELFVYKFLHATDVGTSIVVHTFGAYFGLAVAWVNYRKETKEAGDKEGSVYNSDLFSMIGTLFLWICYPSFNGATAIAEGRTRAFVNTYLSLSASCIVAFAMSTLLQKDKFNMVHIQNATLAGGVAVGTFADMIIQPWGAVLTGSVAGAVSILGFVYLSPFLNKRLRLHDTCGVHNLHGMPGMISGLGSIVAGGVATREIYGDGLEKIFYPGRTPGQQAAYQAAAVGVNFGMAIVCGTITGLVLRLPIWNIPTVDEIFDDDPGWILPTDADDESVDVKTGHYKPSVNQGYENADSLEMQDRDRKAEDY